MNAPAGRLPAGRSSLWNADFSRRSEAGDVDASPLLIEKALAAARQQDGERRGLGNRAGVRGVVGRTLVWLLRARKFWLNVPLNVLPSSEVMRI